MPRYPDGAAVLDRLVRFRASSRRIESWRLAARLDGRGLSEWLRWLADRRAEDLTRDDARRAG